MRCFPPLAGALLIFPGASALGAQASKDTVPVHVVERMLDAFDQGNQAARSRLYDSVYYFQELMVPPPGDPKRPTAMSADERARKWQGPIADSRVDTLPQRSRKVLQRMVVGRFVVYHIAVVFKPPHEDNSFEKLEVYEVKNGKIVAEYDGQHTSSGRATAAAGP
ncbi:MAG TPA: hypothetical protein VHR41_01215 [Gemmatimonadales bacterium]|nr:hypothetical protein [Gemmatimonadales bacterium]